MEPKLERGNDTEIAAAASQRPEQIRVLVLRGPQLPAIGRHDLGSEQIVDGQTMLAHQPGYAAA